MEVVLSLARDISKQCVSDNGTVSLGAMGSLRNSITLLIFGSLVFRSFSIYNNRIYFIFNIDLLMLIIY